MAERFRPRHFPPPNTANPDGVVAAGGAPVVDLLEDAYRNGIFPWPHDGLPLLWFSPDPRFVLLPTRARVPRSVKKMINRGRYRITADTVFADVLAHCSAVPRPGQDGTWITDSMREGYEALHARGCAHSVEAWEGDRLVGGLYGVSFGRAFFGESMFALTPDASKVAFVTLLGHLVDWEFSLVDCQVYTEHLARFGAEDWSRADFLRALARALDAPDKPGPWRLPLAPKDALQRLARAGEG